MLNTLNEVIYLNKNDVLKCYIITFILKNECASQEFKIKVLIRKLYAL